MSLDSSKTLSLHDLGRSLSNVQDVFIFGKEEAIHHDELFRTLFRWFKTTLISIIHE